MKESTCILIKKALEKLKNFKNSYLSFTNAVKYILMNDKQFSNSFPLALFIEDDRVLRVYLCRMRGRLYMDGVV